MGAAIALLSTGIELVADQQLVNYLRQPREERPPILQTGLWRYSRHPNYFGEWGFWFGLGVMSCQIVESPLLVWSGTAVMLALFLGFSVGALDKRSLERREGYEEYMRQTSGFFLWFPKKP